MDYITLIFQQPGRKDRLLSFETAPSEAQQAEPHLLTLERLPLGGTYRESHGAGIGVLTLRGTFGYEQRNHEGQTKTGFELFQELRQLYRDYTTSMRSKDHRIASGTKLQYHNHTEKEHWYVEATEFRTPRGQENRLHYIYELDLKLINSANRTKYTTMRPSKRAVIQQTGRDLALGSQQLQSLKQPIQLAVQAGALT